MAVAIFMFNARLGVLLQRVDNVEAPLCSAFNRFSDSAVLLALFRSISRLGDGGFWYSLMALMPLVYGREGLFVTVHMALTGLAAVLLYKQLKTRLVRERPFVGRTSISCSMPPLDRYSFPSGHTLHAVSFSLVLCGYYPVFAWVLVPFTLLIAMSRLVLGLHYPSDVMFGAMLGYGLATCSFELAGHLPV